MNDYKRKTEEAERKVIRLQLDANFFFERAVRSLDRYRYDKALTYFQKAVEYEPDNPIHHCNLAGILSELGKYEASNEALRHIVEHVEPMMSECHFYMANNYANMEQFAEAERELLIYMEKDANGSFGTEANELLDVVRYERARSGKPHQEVSEANHDEAKLEPHQQGRVLLEQGDVQQACIVLQQALAAEPDDDATRNNLAVAFYHLGELERAANEVAEVLRRDPYNLHGLCNQALILRQMGQHSRLLQQIVMLRQVHPLHHEHLLKLAITLAMLGQHDAAYPHFCRLVRMNDTNQQEIYHYAAVAACYVGKYDQGEQWWRRMLRIEPEAEVPAFYIAHLEQLRQGQLQPSYSYMLPSAAVLSDAASAVSEAEHAANDESRFIDMLRYGTQQQQLHALQACALEGSHELHRLLRDYAAAPHTSAVLKLAAERLLRQWTAAHSLVDDRLIDDLESARTSLPIWEPCWQQVLDIVLLQSPLRQHASFQHDVEALWLEFIKRSYPELPRLMQPEGWAAALEYLVARLFRQPLTYAEVAERYGSTISSVSRYARRISRLCHIRSKMQRSLAQSNQGS
ncbi:tetratricopeptide repeat protein [Paenibacillus campi]|uniref:tetratricopeptide repeat protein n=1 Tax=Paenibacillus campi TaxID=3106031 RepID=UPI002AFFB869|nr:tetratricopeptide repeat protein [Paenibacillus sp. SGZ-1014]